MSIDTTIQEFPTFSVIEKDKVQCIKPKKIYGRVLPFILKNGIIEGIILPKEGEGLIKYEVTQFDQLADVCNFCTSIGWQCDYNLFTHLGFWRTDEIVDTNVCVWGLDINQCSNSNDILTDDDIVILPVGSILNLSDSIASASLLKLLVHLNKSK